MLPVEPSTATLATCGVINTGSAGDWPGATVRKGLSCRGCASAIRTAWPVSWLRFRPARILRPNPPIPQPDTTAAARACDNPSSEAHKAVRARARPTLAFHHPAASHPRTEAGETLFFESIGHTMDRRVARPRIAIRKEQRISFDETR